jgi:diadenosine tetraphosphate (Ap4A) HIT family hydrolase
VIPFAVDPAFEAASVFVADGPLCQWRLQDDARFPWLILIPRVAGAVELSDLPPEGRAGLLEEAVRAGERLRALAEEDGEPLVKLNTAALGNITRQLHVHVIGRREDDPAWPGPVWGVGERRPYDLDRLAALVERLRAP